MPRFEIRPTTFEEVAAKAPHLFASHWDEIALHKQLMALKPDVARYRQLEAAGTFFALAAYDGDELVGYSGNFIGPHLHYADLRYANNDVLFVAKEHRSSPLGLKLIRETEREARRRGARMVLWHAKENTPLASIMPKLKYGTQDIIFSKQLPESHFQLVARNLDASAALNEIQANADLWDLFTARQDTAGSPHRDTRCIVLRGPERVTADTVFNDLHAIDYPAIETLPALRDLARGAVARLNVVELGRVMLVELAAGGRVDRHFDDGAYAAHYERFHLVLQSDAGNHFTIEDETIHLEPGELWRIDHRCEHEVHNGSARPRIHLIIDATVQH